MKRELWTLQDWLLLKKGVETWFSWFANETEPEPDDVKYYEKLLRTIQNAIDLHRTMH